MRGRRAKCEGAEQDIGAGVGLGAHCMVAQVGEGRPGVGEPVLLWRP
jgi:hypothetical protein